MTRETEAECLRLRKVTERDAMAVFGCWMRDEAVSRYMQWQAEDSPEAAKAFVKYELERMDDPGWQRFLIERKDTDELTGTCLVFRNDDEQSAHWDVSYDFGSAFWGYAT